ncbi:MAG: substrate-binding domain-containing protein [Candidatus Zixiibacteriota bacterium]
MKKTLLVLALFSLLLVYCGRGPEKELVLATTTSVQDSGLLEYLLPFFEKENSCKVKVIAVGSGQAMRLAKDGNVDLLLVHDPRSEEEFIREGYGKERVEIMYNDFVLVGAAEDPAGIKNQKDILSSLVKIRNLKKSFISRADNSGTHNKERSLWESAGVIPEGEWYLESGCGMEATLRLANQKKGYCLTDRATFLSHCRELDLVILFQGEKNLRNQYSAIIVSPDKFPEVNYNLALKFVSFLTNERGQKLIGEFGREKYGQALFVPNARMDQNEPF